MGGERKVFARLSSDAATAFSDSEAVALLSKPSTAEPAIYYTTTEAVCLPSLHQGGCRCANRKLAHQEEQITAYFLYLRKYNTTQNRSSGPSELCLTKVN